MNPGPMRSATAADPLATLRGYHLPEPVGWWPPAPGWWLVALLLCGVLAGLVLWGVRRRRRMAAARSARAELAALRQAVDRDGDAHAFACGLSRLLRRFALARFPRRGVAGLTGEQWLSFLDVHGGAGRFSRHPGRLLIEAPYRQATDVPARELAALAEDWIAANAEGRS
jgi:hypothetical protein